MTPNFSKITIDTLAKRAAYICSNPDCRVSTSGPNSNPEKSTILGEAAHIYGARKGSKRYSPVMTDVARAEITNSIWLCRNCHKLIDTDEKKYFPEILFIWREKHEAYISSQLGNVTDRIRYEEQHAALKDFENYPPIVKRIIIDKPPCWEYRLTAELLRFLNDPLFRKLKDLRDGLYAKGLESIESDDALPWIYDQLDEMSRIGKPVVGLMDHLTKSWGAPGESGDVEEIHHVVKLIQIYLENIISFEEKVKFVRVPEEYQRLKGMITNLIGSQVEKLSSIPEAMDEIVLLNETYENGVKDNDEHPRVIRKEFVIEFPSNWEKEFSKELNKMRLRNEGCLLFVFIIMITATYELFF